MQSGGTVITNLKVYTCGHCMNDFHKAVKNVPRQKQKIPAKAVLFQHDGDYYLFDTGYSTRVLENGWRSKLYHMLNPVMITKEESLAVQLVENGIDLAQIKGIILSHLHPDHIGGLRDFPDCKLFLSRDTYLTFQKPKLLDLIFTNLLPEDFEKRIEVLEIKNDCDLFGDGSVVLKDISGHAKGQMGMFLPEYNTFYAADASWSLDLLGKPMKIPGRLFQEDYKAYQNTANVIKGMQEAGVRIVFSHEVSE